MTTLATLKQPAFSNGSVVKFQYYSLKNIQSKLATYGISMTSQEITNHIEKQSQGVSSGRNIVVGFNWSDELNDYSLYLDLFYVGRSKDAIEMIPEFNRYTKYSGKPEACQFTDMSVYTFAY